MTGLCILLTGFEPFDGESINPSWQLAQALAGEVIAGHRIVAVRLPCVFGVSLELLRDAMAKYQPQLVLALGQGSNRSRLSLERIAINIDDARIPDNAGAQPTDVPIVENGAAAFFSSLPIKTMLTALHDAGIPAEISQSAGTFVCNHVFYGLMHALAEQPDVRGGFLHVPYLPEQAAQHPGASCLSLADGINGIRIALRAALA